MFAASYLAVLILAGAPAAVRSPTQSPAQSPVQAAVTTPGPVIATRTYHDAALHFTLTYPATLKAEALGGATVNEA